VALMEAMACGIPVIGTQTGGIPELLRDGAGLMVPPNDPEALAEALRSLGGDPPCERAGRRGAQTHRPSSFASRLWQRRLRSGFATSPSAVSRDVHLRDSSSTGNPVSRTNGSSQPTRDLAYGRRLQRRSQDRIFAIEVDAGEGISTRRARRQRERSIVAGALGCCADSVVRLPERVGEIAARTAKFVLELRPRIAKLTGQLCVRQLGQVRVRDCVRSDLDPALGNRAKLVPSHSRELVGVHGPPFSELRNGEGPAVSRVFRACEDRRGDGEALDDRNRVRDALIRVVERHVKKLSVRADGVGERGGAEAAEKQGLEVVCKLLRWDCELIWPRLGHRVVAEDERVRTQSR
jgi:Glycosyl transferases group 1